MTEPEEFLSLIKRGVDWGPYPLKLLWTAPDKKHLIFTAPGHNYRSGQETKYGRARHCLVRLDVPIDTKYHHGYELYRKSLIAEVYGRIGKKKLAELIAKIPAT